MAKQGVIIRTNGKIEPVKIGSLEDMQSAVGGMIDVLHLAGSEQKHGMSVYINDEGRLLEQPINMTVCLWLLRRDAYDGLSMPIHGDVLIMGPTNKKGESTSLSTDIIDMIPRFWVEPSIEVFSFDEAGIPDRDDAKPMD
jgi:hypothetical protein